MGVWWLWGARHADPTEAIRNVTPPDKTDAELCPYFVADLDTPRECAYCGHPAEAHSERAREGIPPFGK